MSFDTLFYSVIRVERWYLGAMLRAATWVHSASRSCAEALGQKTGRSVNFPRPLSREREEWIASFDKYTLDG